MIAKLYYVRCDGCGAPCGGTDDLRDSAASAREVARQSGWLRRIARGPETAADFCADCRRPVPSPGDTP